MAVTNPKRVAHERRQPRWLKFRSSKKLIGATAFVAAFSEGFIYASVVPVLPFSLVTRLGVPEAHVQYWLSLLLMTFGITMTLGSPIAGWVADHTTSRQPPFLFGLALAYGATLLFCFATSPSMLILARCFQGFASSILYTVSLALIADNVEPSEIGSWMGLVLSGMNLGALIAPFVAGAVYEHAGYYAVFSVVLGVLVFDSMLRLFMIEKKAAAKWLHNLRPDEEATPSPEAAAPNQTDDVSEESPALVVGRPLSPRMAQVQHSNNEQPSLPQFGRAQSPVNGQPMPPGNQSDETSPLLRKASQQPASWFHRTFPTMALLLGSPRLMTAVYGCFTHTTIIAAFDAILPQFVKHRFDWTPTGAGTIFLAITVPSLLGPVVGALSDRHGTRKISLLGFATTIPFLAMLGLVRGSEVAYQVLLVILLVVTSVGLNTLLSPLAADMFYEVENLAAQHPNAFGKAGAYGQAYSLFDGALGLATFMGPLWGGLFYETTGWAVCMMSLAGLCALGGVPVFVFTGGSRK